MRQLQDNGDMEVTVIDNFEQLESIQPIWRRMQEQEPFPATNADINRYVATLKQQEDMQPLIMLFKQQGNPIAMVTARIDRHRIKHRIGYKFIFQPFVHCLTVVYGGILGQPDYNTCALILKEIMKVSRDRRTDVIFFNQLRVDSNMFRAARTIPPILCRNYFSPLQPHWQTSLKDLSDSSRSPVSQKNRRDSARCERNLSKTRSGPVTVVCYRNEADLDKFITVAHRISSLTYKEGLGVGFIDNPATRSILAQTAKDGWLRAYVLYAGSEPVAFEYGSVYGGIYFADQAAFDPRWRSYGPGTILQFKIFEHLCSEGSIEIYDYGFGDAGYKQKLGSNFWNESTVYIYAPRLYPVLINLIGSLIKGLSLGLAFFAHKLGFTTTIKRYWRKGLQRKAKLIKQAHC